MAKAVISNLIKNKVSFVTASDFPLINVKDVNHRTYISDVPKFRIKFVNIGIEGYSPSNPAPIGIAVIGLNNWIL